MSESQGFPPSKIWATRLRQYARGCRERQPHPARETLSAEEERQCQIIGGSILHWLREAYPEVVKNRRFFKMKFPEPEPRIVVFTSSVPGLVAANEIFESDTSKVVWLLEDEFNLWSQRNRDEEYLFHSHFWSVMTSDLEESVIARASKESPLIEGESYRLHKVGQAWGRLAASGSDHLWKWDGQDLTLLQEGFREWIS